VGFGGFLTRHKHPVSLYPFSLSLSLFFLCKGLPLKDEKGHEHEHEPLVQARQHRTAIANGMSSGGMGVVGVRHHGVGARMSPLEIGMYVLLAAFCFAIVVFVVSCVVYASKFKPQPPDSPLTGAAVPVLSGAGARARAAANQLASGKRPPRESTTNAHDWVWLGRATLERAACGPQQVD
jgi:transmembrane protein 132